MLSVSFKRQPFMKSNSSPTTCSKSANMIFKESLSRPILSSSCEIVRMYVCMYLVPSPCNFSRGLSLTLRSHDQFRASHWLTPPSPPPCKASIFQPIKVCRVFVSPSHILTYHCFLLIKMD